MSAYKFSTIFTLEARSNILLEVIAERFSRDASRMFHEIQSSHKMLVDGLSKKGIKYANLKGALIPHTDRNERAFVFDSHKAGSGWYGRRIVEYVVSLFDPKSTHSVLLGDWIYHREHNQWSTDLLRKALHGARSPYQGQVDELYFVYVNNLSDKQAKDLDDGLRTQPGYLGYLDLNFASTLKAYLSTMLVRAFIKHRKLIIQSHEDDRDDAEDVNLIGYDFAQHGYTVRSVPSWLYGILLSYKIERPVFLPADSDTRFSLNALGPELFELDQLEVFLEEPKLRYLQSNHAHGLNRAGCAELSAAEIAEQIRLKIKSNYIYNLARADDGRTLKFNIILENPNVAKVECALEYRPAEKLLRLITIY
jgi:hypothetical protein